MDLLHFTPLEIESLRLSLWVSICAASGSLVPGIFIAWVLARVRFPGRALLDGIVHLPLVLPPVVTGYFLLVLMGRHGMVGSWLYDLTGFSFAFSWKGAALAAGVMAFPLLVRAVRLSFESLDRDLEEAAHTLGAGRARVFFTITLPLSFPGILTGIILAFARSLGEFGATISFVSNIPGETRTLPLALYNLIQQPGGEHGAFRLCIIAAVLALFALIISDLLARRRVFRMRGER